MTRYLITGGGGMLAADLARALEGRDVTSASHSTLDITNLDAVHEAAAGIDVIINAAAYTNVDGAETDEARAHAVNAIGPANLATVASQSGARLVQMSTDYVFDGAATAPYAEHAPRKPTSAYGRTKAEGEELVLAIAPEHASIVRTAWLYGAHGSNFARTMARLGRTQDELTVVTDQVGGPTWSQDVARQVVALVDAGTPAGIFHATNSGRTSWFEFARAIFAELGWDPQRIHPTTTVAFGRPAPRPAYSVLGQDAWSTIGLAPLRDWREALAAAHAAGVLDEVREG